MPQKKTARRTFRTPNTSTMVFKYLQELREHLKETEKEVKDVKKNY